MVEWAAARGKEAACEYAEAFCQHRGHAYPSENVLAQILGAEVVASVG